MSEMREATRASARFPVAGGEMAELIRRKDWSQTALGPLEGWPQALKTVVAACLDAGFPQVVFWGADLVQVYNDAAIAILRAKHPGALGQPARECWAEIGADAAPLLERVMTTGKAERQEGFVVTPDRGAPREPACFDFCYGALRDESGAIAGVLVTGIETTERVRAKQALAALRESERGFRALANASSQAFFVMNADWSELYLLRGDGFLADTDAPTKNWLEKYIHPGDRARVGAEVAEAVRTQRALESESRVVLEDGNEGWWAARAVPIFNGEGKLARWLGAAGDISARKRVEAHRKLLLNELNHRVKNTLATVQSIAMQTLGGAPESAELVWRFESRLMALAKAHSLLTRRHWRGAALKELLAQELEPFGGETRARFAIAGDDVELEPKAALALAMAFHELATNAVKYGALSGSEGKIRIVSEVRAGDGGRVLRLTWTESDGPEVAQPMHRGFGTRLVRSGLAHELQGEVRLDYQPAGLVCTMRIPLASEVLAFD
jgi:two-component sensor histidine kinase